MAQKALRDALFNKFNPRLELLQRLLKHEQYETPPRFTPVMDGNADDSNVSAGTCGNNNLQTKKTCLLLPKNCEDNQGTVLDQKDEVQRLLPKVKEQQQMPHLDNECQNSACGQDNGTDPESTATSSVHSDDTPPRLTAAQLNSSFSSNVEDEEDSRGEYCDDNASPPPLDKYVSSTSSPISGTKTKDATLWTVRLRRRPFHATLINATHEAGPSMSKKNCLETDWANRLTDVLAELHPRQLVLAKETIYSTVVKILAQEITSDISCLMNLIENQDRRAAAFDRVIKDLKKLKSDYACDSSF